VSARRTLVNLAAVGAASAALITYAITSLLVGALLDDSYPLSVRLPESGGLLAGQEVTLAGRVVGRVSDVRLEGEAVIAELAITKGEQIPSDVAVTVLRRSPVGEQAMDFRPGPAPSAPLEPGAVVDALDATTPVPVQRLLEMADRTFGPIETDKGGLLIRELAAATRGRSQDIRSIIQNSATFSEAIADNEAEIARFFSSSRPVNSALAGSRQALARSIGQMADAAGALVRMRSDFQGLLNEAPRVLDQVTTLVDRSQANLSCSLGSLAGLTEHLAQPGNLDNIEEALRLNRWFFVGFEVGGPRDPAGRVWNRIQFITPQESTPDSYMPDKRPIPDIWPGGACASPFGAGAPAAAQAGFTSVTVDNEVVAAGGAQPVSSVEQVAAAGTAGPSPFAALLGLAGLALAGRRVRRWFFEGSTR
jgi:virulence factor Mce-like protein